MQKFIVSAVAVLLASCTPPPKTLSEFREAMLNRPAMTKQESHAINRELSAVVKDIDRKSKECLQFGHQTTVRHGASARMTTVVYRPTTRMVGKNKAEMFLQQERMPKPIGGPEGGAYIFLTDLKTAGSGKTQMTMYGPSFPTWNPIFDAIKGWGEGKNVKCPDEP